MHAICKYLSIDYLISQVEKSATLGFMALSLSTKEMLICFMHVLTLTSLAVTCLSFGLPCASACCMASSVVVASAPVDRVVPLVGCCIAG